MKLPTQKISHFIKSQIIHQEEGIIGLIVVILLIAGIILGVYLVQTHTNLLPKAFDSISGPSQPTPLDSDNDGFSDNAEIFMGTNPNKACPTNSKDDAWPVDVTNDGAVNGADMSALVPFISGGLAYNRRYDLNQDGKISGTTSPATGDVGIIQNNFLKTCSATPSASPSVSQSAKLDIFKQITPTLIGQEASFQVHVSSPNDLINLVSSQLSFTPTQIEVTSIELNKTVFTHEIEKFYDNTTGQISIIAGLEKPGISNAGSQITTLVATVNYRVKGSGQGSTTIKTDSKILRISDNKNIINQSALPFTSVLSNAPVTPTSVPTTSPVACNPRPNINRTAQMTSQGLLIKLSAATNETTSNNKLSLINFTKLDNGTVVIENKQFTAPFGYTVPSNITEVSFLINQVTLNMATTVTLSAKDICGETTLFFGGGTAAVWPTVIPSAPPPPTPSPAPVACTLTNAKWVLSANPANTNTTAGLQVDASGDCTNQQVDFTVLEDDGVLGTDPVQAKPQTITLLANAQTGTFLGKTSWITEFQEDGIFGTSSPPEYQFIAQLVGKKNTITSVNPELQVLRAAGVPSPVEGDMNGDGSSDLSDISWLLSNWGPINKNELVDYNKDGVINNFDISNLVGVLKQKGILKNSAN